MKTPKLLLASFMMLSGMLFFNSCEKDQVALPLVDSDCPDTISFSLQIKPMVDSHCISCHDTGNSTGYTLTDYSSISTNASVVLNSLRGEAGVQLMPTSGALPDSLIQQFSCWVSQGKLNN